MMYKTTKIYNVLISCPSDVAKYIDNIKRGIDKFNRGFGEYKGVMLRTKYWKDDVFAQSGGDPQSLINAQIVRTSDIAIAVFWTKFGEPTTHYGSGTQDEIETMISEGKQVFVYFLEKPVSPSSIDRIEYKKIINFKKKYRDIGIYITVADEFELELQVEKGLERYFSC